MNSHRQSAADRPGDDPVWVSAADSVPDRLERVVEAVSRAGGAAILLGDPGSGKTRLAEEAAYVLEGRHAQDVAVIVLPSPNESVYDTAPPFEQQFLDHCGIVAPGELLSLGGTPELAHRIIERIRAEAAGREPVIVAPGLDQYPAALARLLASLVRSRRVRLIATAHRLTGAAERVSRDPQVRLLTVGPLSYAESSLLLTGLLDVEWIEFETLRRWMDVTGGSAYSLSVLALALDRRGVLERSGGLLWEETESATAPDEYSSFIEETCTPEEIEALEIVALAEPLAESSLLEKLDPASLRTLHARGLIVSSARRGGRTVLTVSHPLLSTALRSRMSASRRQEVQEDLYLTLRHELGRQDPTLSPDRLCRLVPLGLDTGRLLPLEWLTAALERLNTDHEPVLAQRIAFAVGAHPDASPADLAFAAVRASRASRLIGDAASLARTADAVVRLLARAETGSRVGDLPLRLRVDLHFELISHLTLEQERIGEAHEALAALEQEPFEPGGVAAETARSARVLLFARTGRLRRALGEAPGRDELGSMRVEWARALARVISSLVLAQRGAFAAAIDVAEEARVLAGLGENPQGQTVKLLKLCSFVGALLAGETGTAAEEMNGLREDALREISDIGFVELGLSLLALQEGRWSEAAQRAARAGDRVRRGDTYGLAPLLDAVVALARAALGDRAGSRVAIRAAEVPRPGVGLVLRGLLRVLTLEARHWNRERDVSDHARSTIEWAAAEDLPLIELRAMRVLAAVQGGIDQGGIARARKLAVRVDGPLGPALLDFFEGLAAGERGNDTPAIRLLADFGIWLPLPRTSMLSSREREIALHASLGYSSRWIATRFHLSPRTVEAHLRNVFIKLGVTGRDELRAQLGSGLLA